MACAKSGCHADAADALRKDQSGDIAKCHGYYTDDEPVRWRFSQLFRLSPGSRTTAFNRTTIEAARASLRRRSTPVAEAWSCLCRVPFIHNS